MSAPSPAAPRTVTLTRTQVEDIFTACILDTDYVADFWAVAEMMQPDPATPEPKTFRVRWTDWTVWALNVSADTAEQALQNAQAAWEAQVDIGKFEALESSCFDDADAEVQP